MGEEKEAEEADSSGGLKMDKREDETSTPWGKIILTLIYLIVAVSIAFWLSQTGG